MTSCLFCNNEGPFTRPEHIVPEALGNDDLVLENEVCDGCNQYFGSKVESFVLNKTPLGFWRTFLGIRTKKGKLPHVDLSQPRRRKGRLPAIHPLHDNLGFTCHSDRSISMDINDDQFIRETLEKKRNRFTFVFSPLVLSMMGRFFCKVGVELICSKDREFARSDVFSQARGFSRFGDFKGLWPIFHVQSGSPNDLRERRTDSQGIIEEVFCYEYRVLEVSAICRVLSLTVGTDTWIVCLNDPYPHPMIRSAFPDQELQLIWYDGVSYND